jgi:hypothetical protein
MILIPVQITILSNNNIWVVVLTMLKNMKDNGKDDIPYIMEKNAWNHQPDNYIIQY